MTVTQPRLARSNSAPRTEVSRASWTFGTILLAFILAVFVFAPRELPEFKLRILSFTCAMTAGLFGFFMTGDIGLRFTPFQGKAGKIVIRATGGLALFVLVLWWWFSSGAPVKKLQQVVIRAANKTAAEVNQNTDAKVEGLKEAIDQQGAETRNTVKNEGEKTRDTVQEAALATLETMFPLAVRIPREVDGTIMHISGSEIQRIISYDQNKTPMKLYWGDLFQYFVFDISDRLGTVYLQLGEGEGSTRLPIEPDPSTEKQLRIPGHNPRPMEAFIYNPSHLKGFSLKIMVSSADRERGRKQFRETLLKTELGSYARRSYLAVTQDDTPLLEEADKPEWVLRSMNKDTYVKKLKTQGKWTQIRLPEGREGWVASKFLGPIS